MLRNLTALLLFVTIWAATDGAALRSPKSDSLPRLDQYGDPLPVGVLVRLGSVRLRPGLGQPGLAFMPDGKTLISGRESWDIATGRRVRVLAAGVDSPYALALSANGKVVALGGPTGIALLDTATGSEVRKLNAGPVRSLAFTPDGLTLVSGGEDREPVIRVWDVASGQELRRMLWHKREVSVVACAPDGKTLISASGVGRVIHWADLETGEEIRFLRRQHPDVECLALSPNGQMLAVGGMRFRKAAAPGARTLDASLQLLDAATGQVIREFEGHEHTVQYVAFSPDSKLLASASYDHTIRLWDVATGNEVKAIREIEPVEGGLFVRHLAFSPDGRTLAAGGGMIHLYDVATGKDLFDFPGHQRVVTQFAFSPDGKILATASGEKNIRLWDIESGKEVRQLKGHEQPHSRMIFLPDGKTMVSGSSDSSIRLWDATTGKQIWCTVLHDAASGEKPLQVRTMATYDDAKKLVAFCYPWEEFQDGWIMKWDLTTGRELSKRRDHRGFDGRTPDFSPDGTKSAYTSHRGPSESFITVFDSATDNQLLTLDVPGGCGPGLFAPNSKLMAVRSSEPAKDNSDPHARINTILVYELSTGKIVQRILSPERDYPYGSMQFSPDSNKLGFVSGNQIHLWALATDKECWTSPKLDCQLTAIAFAPDGRRLASGMYDASVLIWDLSRTGKN